MTTQRADVELQVLGPLEARIAGRSLSLGGSKQRAVLAVLLLRAGEVVSVERLVDEVWGDGPPPSAAHSLESYVSRLRQLFTGQGPAIVRRGAGYVLELRGAVLDAEAFAQLHDDAAHAAAEGMAERAAELAVAALAVWRGPALADVALASAGRAEAERLEELRLRTYEVRFEAELELGRHEHVVGELQSLVGQNPYRERFVAELMLALYRAGRQAEALDVYERIRRRLDSDLGLQPSQELQQLSGQMVRQDPALRPRPPSMSRGEPRRVASEKTGRFSGLVAAGAATIFALAFTASGSTAVQARPVPTLDRLAIIFSGSAEATHSYPARSVAAALRQAEILYDLKAESLFVEDVSAVEAVASEVASGGFGLAVVLGSGTEAKAFARSVPDLLKTRFAFVDASLRDLSLEKAPNAIAVRFAEEDSTYLAGYLSGLSEPKNGSRDAIDAVSVVAGAPDARTKKLVDAYTRGLRNALRGATVYVDYSRELVDPTRCERLANRRIDLGADIVVALAGRCGLGALAVAKFRGIWGIGADGDGVSASSSILTTTTKEFERGALTAVEGLLDGTLTMGKDVVLGLEDDYAVALQMSYLVPEHIQSLVIHRCGEIRVARALDTRY